MFFTFTFHWVSDKGYVLYLLMASAIDLPHQKPENKQGS